MVMLETLKRLEALSPGIYPFQPQSLELEGGQLRYLDEGQGEPVLMLHGNPTWSIFYRSLVSALRGRARAIVPDHLGMGLSDKPDGARYDYRLQSRVDDVERLVDHLKLTQPLTLVLHDWGGMIGMAFAARHPKSVARIVLMNTAAFHLPRSMRLPLALRLVRDTPLGAVSVRGFNAFSRGAAWVGAKRRPLSGPLRSAYCAPYDSWANRIATLRFVEDIPLAPHHPSYKLVSFVEAGLAQFRSTPALICWGERDFVFTPKVLGEWERRWPQAEIQRFPDCGHYLLEDAPEEVCARVIRFLEEHPLPVSGVRA